MVVTGLSPYSIWTKGFEKEMDKKYGIKLSEIQNGQTQGLERVLEIARSEFPIFVENPLTADIEEEAIFDKRKISKLIDDLGSLPGYCSMLIKDENELNEHIKRIYELTYLHYILGKSENIKGEFPNYCCGISSSHLFLAFLRKGFVNASEFGDGKSTDFFGRHISGYNHCYSALPFFFEDTREEGFIIADPTSNQLWFKDKSIIPPRNLVFIVKSREFKYETDWFYGENLYPKLFCNLATLREWSGTLNKASDNVQLYFEKVFKNPIKLNIRN